MNEHRLKAARKHCGLTQNQLAEMLGVSKTLPGQWERGERHVSSDQLLNIAKALGVTGSWLLGEEVTEEPMRASDITGPRSILADASAPPGLRDLAERKVLAEALEIEPHEWAALRSFRPNRLLSSHGYVVVLLTMRGTLHIKNAV